MLYTAEDIRQLNNKIQYQAAFIDRLRDEVGRVIVGQHHMLDRLLIGLLSNGHVLLEGVPGLAKTLAIKSLAQAIHAHFSRIQFTPDLLPADVIGTMIYNQQKHEFVVRKGPIFANFVLADEINRAPAKVQSALLEAMQERQVTIGDTSYKLEEPFLVLATQNPLEQEGTYPLPEAQQDRFIMKVIVDYPTKQEEQLIIRQNVQGGQAPRVEQVVSMQEITQAKDLARQVYMDEKVEHYILDIVFATRTPEKYKLDKLKPLIAYGGSPRASINLALAAKANAFLNKRGYVIPEDVRTISKDVLRHRIGLTYEAEAESVNVEQVIDDVLKEKSNPNPIIIIMLTTAEILKKVRELDIKSKRLTRHLFTGEYHSAFKGRGMSFREVREYAAGDDIRFIDWNVSARFNHPFSKLFEEERELSVMLLVDVSASSLFGTVHARKKDLITEICTVLAFSAINNNDKVGVILFSDKIEGYIPPKKGREHVLYIVRQLLTTEPRNKGTNLREAIRFLNRSVRQKSIVFFLSDFIEGRGGEAAGASAGAGSGRQEERFEDALKVVGKKHDVVGIKVYDKMDMQLPAIGMIDAEDSETGRRYWVDTDDYLVRTSYQQHFFDQTELCKGIFQRAGSDLLHLRTDEDYVKILQRFFVGRHRPG